jgi:hypothetical protein
MYSTTISVEDDCSKTKAKPKKKKSRHSIYLKDSFAFYRNHLQKHTQILNLTYKTYTCFSNIDVPVGFHFRDEDGVRER